MIYISVNDIDKMSFNEELQKDAIICESLKTISEVVWNIILYKEIYNLFNSDLENIPKFGYIFSFYIQ